MQVLERAAIAMALALPLATMPLTAQRYRWDANVNGGWTWLTHVLNRDEFDFADFDVDFDVFEGVGDDIKLGSNWIVGSQLGYWFTNTIGLRANFAYTDPELDQGGRELFGSINLWSGTGDVMIRLFNRPRERWDGFEWLPFVALGLGAQWINPAGDRFIAVDDIDLELDPDGDGIFAVDVEGNSGLPIVCLAGFCQVPGPLGTILPVGARTFFLEEETKLAGLIGLGVDLRLAPSFAVRLEVGDRIWEAPIREVFNREGLDFIVESGDDLGSTVNQFYATVGAAFLFGLERPPRVAVVPTPAPPPPPPPPPPATEEITVCVVDPTYAGGVRMITATRHLTTGDTTVMKNGDKVKLSDAVGMVPTVSNAPWYVSGGPFEIGSAPNRIQYLSVGGARIIEPTQLAYLGTAHGLPVFADRMTMPPGLTNLGPNTDLNRLVMESADARKALDMVAVVYVPLQPVGCVFQALQKQVEVRKK